MTTLSYTEARDKLAAAWDETLSTREPIIFERRGHEAVVLLPLHEWESMAETAHLLRSPANAQRLLAALKRLEEGHGTKLTSDELASRVAR